MLQFYRNYFTIFPHLTW